VEDLKSELSEKEYELSSAKDELEELKKEVVELKEKLSAPNKAEKSVKTPTSLMEMADQHALLPAESRSRHRPVRSRGRNGEHKAESVMKVLGDDAGKVDTTSNNSAELEESIDADGESRAEEALDGSLVEELIIHDET